MDSQHKGKKGWKRRGPHFLFASTNLALLDVSNDMIVFREREAGGISCLLDGKREVYSGHAVTIKGSPGYAMHLPVLRICSSLQTANDLAGFSEKQ